MTLAKQDSRQPYALMMNDSLYPRARLHPHQQKRPVHKDSNESNIHPCHNWVNPRALTHHRSTLFLPDFDAFYKTYNVKVYYDYKSIAEVISAYNAYKEPNLFLPVKYKYKEKVKFGLNATLGIGNLEVINAHNDFVNENNFSFGLNFKHIYTRSICFNFSLSYNNSSFIGTYEDVFFKTISFDPNLGIRMYINSKLDISLRGGVNLSYNIDSYLIQKTVDGLLLDLTAFNLGPQVGVHLTYIERYSIFINYFRYKINTNEGRRFLNSDDIKATIETFQFGLLYYFY